MAMRVAAATGARTIATSPRAPARSTEHRVGAPAELLSVLAISAGAGAVLGITLSDDISRGAFQGAVSGVLVAMSVRGAGRALSAIDVRRLPFAASIGTTAVVNGVAISAALAKPRLRIAIHCGVVVAGELGDLRREIRIA